MSGRGSHQHAPHGRSGILGRAHHEAIADDPKERRTQAVRRVKDKRAFRDHLVVYIIVNAALVGIWALSGAGYFWPIWAIGGWGIGLATHAWHTYGQKPISEDEIQAEMRRLGGAGDLGGDGS